MTGIVVFGVFDLSVVVGLLVGLSVVVDFLVIVNGLTVGVEIFFFNIFVVDSCVATFLSVAILSSVTIFLVVISSAMFFCNQG